MMSYRHIEELDAAVCVARRAALCCRATGIDDSERVGRLLFHRWYLGLPAALARSGGAPYGHPWTATGELWTDDLLYDLGGTVGLHLTAAPGTTGLVLGLVTDRAKSWEEPWQLTSTAAVGCRAFGPNASVLRLPVSSLGRLHGRVIELLEELRPVLGVTTPALTLRVRPGVALAQSPRNGRTFGEHRCAVLADAVMGGTDRPHREQMTRVMDAFAAAGIDPERPYLDRDRGSWDEAWRMF